MSHPHKPIVTNQCIDEIRRAMRAGETALSVCGFNVTAQAADESYLLSCPKTAAKVTIHVRLFLGDDDYAHTAWKQFLSEVNKAGLGAGLPHITRVARKPAPKGKVINLSRRAYSIARGPIVRSDNLGVYHWRGMIEAARRSQSCPGWLRWAAIKVQPAPALTLVKSDETPAITRSDAQAWQTAREQAAALVAKMSTWPPSEVKTVVRNRPEEAAFDPADYPSSPDQIITNACGELRSEIEAKGRWGHSDSYKNTQVRLDNDLWARTDAETPRGHIPIVVYHESNTELTAVVGELAGDGQWTLFGASYRAGVRAIVEAAGIGDPNAEVDDDPFHEQETKEAA